MVELTENSLSKRQKELNFKVNEAANSDINFDDVKAKRDTSDIDRFFKIDLASKYRNTDYIIETLKSGDPLYISRALKKCTWLYDEEHSNVINTDYLHKQVFPFMSIKMKKKLLTTIAIHLKNEDRARDFYKYCEEANMSNLARKFSINTSESLKLNIIQKNKNVFRDSQRETMKSFFGNSFELFEEYLKEQWNTNKTLSECSYFYTVSDVKYLDLLEKYVTLDSYTNMKFGLRISKDIIVKHKGRVLANPKLYVNILNMGKLIRHSTANDVKTYASGLLPEKATEFWTMGYYKKYKSLINALPETERFNTLKQIYKEKYVNVEFEMVKQFYTQNYHELMTKEEREAWALRHIANNKEILGPGLDYTWYKFVSFAKAFPEIKKYIVTATDLEKRADVLKVLAQSATSNQELQVLLKYYYERHVNESKHSKELFLKKVISLHNVFEFDSDCWEAFNKLFYSIDVYNMADTRCNPDFKIISILYHIINNIEMPEALVKHIEYEISMYSTKKYIETFNEEQKQRVYTSIFNFYLERIKKYAPGTEDQKCIALIHFLLEFMASYDKTKKDIPEDIMEFITRDFKTFRYQQILKEKDQKAITDGDLVRYLKKDSKLVADKTPEVKDQMVTNWYFNMNRLLKKLKIYFTGDVVTEKYIELFNDSLSQKNLDNTLAAMAVYGIFQIGDDKYKIDFMKKFAPTEPKINHSDIDNNVLRTREAICRFACYSRPPVPLRSMLSYLKGDYVKYCLPMFNMYLSNLPQPLCVKFVESLLDAPVSIQKHGLRLAFKCFSIENLRNLVLNSWKNTKNVSLRNVIYTSFFEKTVKEQNKELYDTLKALTLELHEDDKDDVFPMLVRNSLADDLTGDFTEAVWLTIEKFKDNKQNISRKTDVIKHIDDVIYLMKKDTVTNIVSEFISDMFAEKGTELSEAMESQLLYLAKWDLVAHYMVYFTSNEGHLSSSIEMAKQILDKCFEYWSTVISDIYISRSVFALLIQNLKKLRFIRHPTCRGALLADRTSYGNAVAVFEVILNELQEKLPLHEIYTYVWDLRISIISRRFVKDGIEEGANSEGIGTSYGRQLGLLVEEFVKNKIYFSHFTDKIKRLIESTVWDMKQYLNLDVSDSGNKDTFLVAVAKGLLESGLAESNLLALQLLPVDPECNENFYKSVYNAIRQLPDMEIQCSMYEKYYGDCKRRRFQ